MQVCDRCCKATRACTFEFCDQRTHYIPSLPHFMRFVQTKWLNTLSKVALLLASHAVLFIAGQYEIRSLSFKKFGGKFCYKTRQVDNYNLCGPLIRTKPMETIKAPILISSRNRRQGQPYKFYCATVFTSFLCISKKI